MLGNSEDQMLINEITNELNKKSLDELIYLNFNPEHFINEFTKNQRESNEALLSEVKNQNSQFESRKNQYDNIKQNIENCRIQYESKENELKNLLNQKQSIDNQITVERLIEEMKGYIDENFARPKQKLIQQFNNKEITFDDFIQQFRDLSMKYHYYSIIKDKLNLCK
jgi:sugar-specific transcriptional regulator TrmB